MSEPQSKPTLFGYPGWEITLENGTIPVDAAVFLLPESVDKLADGHPCIDEQNHGRIIGAEGRFHLVGKYHGEEIYRSVYDEASQKLEAEMKLNDNEVTVDREKYLFRVKKWLFKVNEQGEESREECEEVLRLRVVIKFP